MVAAGFTGVLRMFRLAVADLDSPSYFVATAAVELGCFKDEGIEVELERIYGAHVGPERLRDGTLHFYGGPAYAATVAFPAWNTEACATPRSLSPQKRPLCITANLGADVRFGHGSEFGFIKQLFKK
jgi:hypothetical protein